MNRIRVRITKQFDLGGFRYVVGAIVGVSVNVAREWIAAGQAEAYDAAATAALTPAATPPPAAS
jgi:hypothetical protein